MEKKKKGSEANGDKTSTSSQNKFLSQKEVKDLINSITDMRDKLFVSLLYETGCLLGELVNIKILDINEREISVNNPDTKETRKVKISSTLSKKISLYVQGNGLDKNTYLFSTQKSEQISVKRAREIVQNHSEKLGHGKLNPQMFRYYHVAHAYLDGVMIDNISSQLGIKRYRVFQILDELNVSSNENTYENFLKKMEAD